MSTEENKAIVRRDYEEFWSKGKLEVADEVIAPDYIRHDPGTPDSTGGLENYKQLAIVYRTALPDLHFTIDEELAEGDKVVIRWTARGTHQGELMGIAPTGRQVTITGIGICRVVNGKIVEEWLNWDALGLMQQIGAIPTE